MEDNRNIPPPPPPLFNDQQNIGAKVTFRAVDGKIYTGTIREIRGNQFRIRYDNFNFEAWLERDKFTILDNNTAALIEQQRLIQPQQQPIFNSPAAASGSFLASLAFWGSIIIIIGFFTNWLSFGYLGGISGLRILISAGQVMGEIGDQEGTIIISAVLLAIIILSAVICFFYSVGVNIGIVFSIFKVLPLLSLIGFVALIVSKSEGRIEITKDFFRIIGIGLYLTLGGSFILAISPRRKR